MDNEAMMTTENMDADLDRAWGEDEYGMDMDEAVQQADQPAEQQEDTPAPESAEEQSGTDQSRTADQPELFTLRNREEQRQVTREELIAMAQKGWDYDKVRQERDQLQQTHEQVAPFLSLLDEAAKKNGMTREEYLDALRSQELMREGMSEEEARRELGFRKREADLNARQTKLDAEENRRNSEAQKEQERQARVSREVAAFREAYPDVKTVPQEVWDQVNKGVPLVTAYTTHENKRLLAELAAERQNNANKQRSPGSLGGNTAPEMDEIDRLWNEDD